MASQRPVVPATIRNSGGLPEVATASPLTIRVAVRGVRRYWWLILMLWVVGSTGLCAAIYKQFKPQYKAVSLIQVSDMADDLYGVRGNSEHMATFLNTQVNLITSPSVLTAAGHDPKAAVLPRIQMAPDVVIELRKSIIVRVRPQTELIEVSMTSEEAYEAATLVNAVVEAFMASNAVMADAEKQTQLQGASGFQTELEGRSDAVEKRWRALVAKGKCRPSVATRHRRTERRGPVATRTIPRGTVSLEHLPRGRAASSSRSRWIWPRPSPRWMP